MSVAHIHAAVLTVSDKGYAGERVDESGAVWGVLGTYADVTERQHQDEDLREARRSIREYQKTTSDLAGTIDLLLSYVEAGTRFTNSFGDINESFYMSLESALGEMADLLRTPTGRLHYAIFQPRLEKLRRATYGIGWGYGDAVQETLAQLDADLGSFAERDFDAEH